MLSRFTNKTVVITGGASGLGHTLARQFAEQKWRVWLLDLDQEKTEVAARELSQRYSTEVNASACDMTNYDQVQQVAETIRSSWQHLDILINNAGVASSGLLQDTPPEKWRRTLSVNLDGVYHGCYAFLSLLSHDKQSHIVNIASFAGIALAPSMVAYNVSKASVISLSECLRVELGISNIGVSAACPAFFQTNLVSSMVESDEATRSRVKRWMASSKVDAEDVAKGILKGIEKNKFYIIAHDYARKAFWIKRFFPNYFAKQAMKQMPKIMANRNSNN